MKLTEERPQRELLLALSPQLVSIRSEETGSKRITIRLTPKTDFRIYENVSAVIDGSIRVVVQSRKTNSKLGETIICLGKDGAARGETIETFISGISEDEELCMVCFEENNLWLIEK